MPNDFFHYTRSEQRGVIVLLILMMFLLLVRFLIPVYRIHQYEKNKDGYMSCFKHFNDSIKQSIVIKDTVFYFHPDKVSSKDLDMLGFSAYQKKNFLAYRNAGGVFKSVKDVEKIYGVDSALMTRIGAYILIERKQPSSYSKKEFKHKYKRHIQIDSTKRIDKTTYKKGDKKLDKKSDEKLTKKVDINKADVDVLKKVRGIGDVFAKRIIKYRTILGGFYTIDQLNEVYGLDPDVVISLRKIFYALKSDVVKIKLNETNQYEMMRHPYLNKQQSITILKIYKECKVSGGISLFYKKIKAKGLERIIPYLLFV